MTYREKRTFKNATVNSHISYICSNTNYITMKTKQLKRVKALLQALKNRVGYSELSKDETKEKFLFAKVNKNKYRIRMIKQERK